MSRTVHSTERIDSCFGAKNLGNVGLENADTLSGCLVLPNPVQEKYAQARHGGANKKAAAMTCKIGYRTARRWEALPEVKARIGFLINEQSADARDIRRKKIREITIDRNDIIMGLADIARDKKQQGRARVSAWVALADFFMLRPRNIEELRRGIGWTEDELDYADQTGKVPDRIRFWTGAATIQDLTPPPTRDIRRGVDGS